MGTDIHPYVEVKTRAGRWRSAPVQVPNERNYVAFAILANVRNGFGFAGVPTHEPLIPISEPKGLPPDTSICNTQGDCDDFDVWLGDHSHSYVTLAELKSYDLNQSLAQNGVVSGAERDRVRAGHAPNDWCGAKHPMGPEDEYMKWSRPLKEAAWLIPEWIQRLEQFKKDNYMDRDSTADERIRVVFGFDS